MESQPATAGRFAESDLHQRETFWFVFALAKMVFQWKDQTYSARLQERSEFGSFVVV